MRSSTCKTSLWTAASLGVLIAGWAIAARLAGREIILPGPAATLQALARLIVSGGFWAHLAATLWRGLFGFGLSYVAGLVCGLLSGLIPQFDAAFRPLLVTVRSTPSMALILLALIWFQSGAVAVFVTFLVVFPIVTQNVTDGIRSIDPALAEMARVYRVKPSRVVRDLYIPSIIPYLAAGATAGLGLTWKVMISAEVLAGPNLGIGTRMDNARIFLNTAEVFAWTGIVIILGLFFDRVLDALVQKKLLYWK